MNSAANKVALVTGAGTGIGKAAAKALLQGGFRVVLTGRNLEKLNVAIQAIGGSNQNCLAVSCDVGQPEQVKKLFSEIQKQFGRIDVLFNNAGMGAPAIPMEDLSYEQWMNVVNANLCGAFLCSQEAIRMMKAQSPQGGRIINNGSISAHAPRGGCIVPRAYRRSSNYPLSRGKICHPASSLRSKACGAPGV
jgi:NAD(P)-dependent dehydrogenase (short-subunit alcohol dehydrogenase family)